MSKKEDAVPSPVAPIETASAPAPTMIYRDKAYTSRTLVLPGGQTAKVVAGRIAADTPALRALLDKHPDFERVEG